MVATPDPSDDSLAGLDLDDAHKDRAIRAIHRETDRGAAIVSAAFLESRLELAIKETLRNHTLKKGATLFDRLFKGYGPLATFGAKIDLAFALEIATEDDYHDLHIIRDVRNDFAHDDIGDNHSPVSFNLQSILDRCANLRTFKSFMSMIATKADEQMTTDIGRLLHLESARGQYVTSAIMISSGVTVRATHRRSGSQHPKLPEK
jgi:hypothetical protein